MEKKGAAFTLIELLAVLAIITLLAGMLLPALSKAKARASLAFCLGQTRQLALAAQLYATENNDIYFPRAAGASWAARLQPNYAGALRLLNCPLDRAPLAPSSTKPKPNALDESPRSYVMNGFDDYFIEVLPEPEWLASKKYPSDQGMPASAAAKPSETICFGEKRAANSAFYVHILLDGPDAYLNALDERRHPPHRSSYSFMDGSARALEFGKSTCPVNFWAVREGWRTNAALCRPR